MKYYRDEKTTSREGNREKSCVVKSKMKMTIISKKTAKLENYLLL